MYLSEPMGNIVQKFNSQKINILYEPANNLFDLHMGLCGIDLYVTNKEMFLSDSGDIDNLILLEPDQENLFNYTCALTNNIMGYASNQKFLAKHLNVGIFVHSCKPVQIKKEDILLMNNNLSKLDKIFFSKGTLDSWKLTSNVNHINYGISRELFFKTQDTKNQKVLLLAYGGTNQNTETLVQILKNNNVEVDVVHKIFKSTKQIRELYGQYSICIDMTENNVVNLITAIACGSIGIAYNANNIANYYDDVPNLYFVNTINDLILMVKQVHNRRQPDEVVNDYYAKHFNFSVFKEHVISLINSISRKTFYI